MQPLQVDVDLLKLVSCGYHLFVSDNFGIFTLNTRIAQFFDIFKVVLHYLIDNGRFIVRVFVLQLRIARVGIVKTCYLSELNFVYQLRGLNYFCIVSISKSTILQSDFQISVKVVCRSVSSLYKHCFFFKAGFEYKQIFLPTCHLQYTPPLLQHYRIGVIMV